MMNSAHNSESYAASPFMSFVGLEGNGSTHSGQKHQLWDWDSTNSLSSTTHSFPFYAPPLLEAPPPPLFSTVPLPFYFPSQPPPPPPTPLSMAIPDYPRTAGFFKLDEGLSAGLGGGYEGARIGLNLGHRTYFSSYDHQLLLFGRSAHHQPPRCQAEGCMADLSGAKHYHRRHKVCDFHSKAAVVFFPGGVQQRFCQQCSRFHGLVEFDDAKRSCRKRLAEHNRRRRKPQPHPPLKGASPSSLAPSINPKEEGDLQASASKGCNKQLSSINKSCNPTTHIRSSSSTSMEKKVTLAQYTSGSALSLGGVAGTVHEQRISTFVSLEENASQYQQQQQLQSHFASPCSSTNAFFQHQNLFTEGSQPAGDGASEANHHNPNNLLQLGQAMFEWDFI